MAAVISLLALAIWALAFRSTMDLIRTEKQMMLREERDTSVTRALAAGIALLHTGPPPTFPSPYQCLFIVTGGEEDVVCTVSYTESSPPGTWTVASVLASEADQAALLEAPASFGE